MPGNIETDPLRLKQILINLACNAIKFTESGHVLIKVEFDVTARKLKFNVIDSGLGMTSEQLQIIFSPFTQADSSTTRRYGGTGLGLSVSKELALKLGGDLTAQSLINIGSQFELSISTGDENTTSLIHGQEELPLFGEKEEVETSFQLNTYHGKVLLAEDNPDNQRLLSHFIGKLGVEIEIAENGEVATKMASAMDYDLIFMDMQMPVMGGLDAVMYLRKNGYTKPIVALTANAMRKDKEDCMSAGCNEFLTKPIERKELYRIAELFLEPGEKPNENYELITSDLLMTEPHLVDLVEKFIFSLPETNELIQRYERNKDWNNLYSIIHQLKGTGGGMGFPILTEIAGKIQFQLMNENHVAMNALIAQLDEITVRIVGTEALVSTSTKVSGVAVKTAS